MSHSDIHPVILCGGSGTRLWPLSRKSYPKQFSKLLGEETLFQACARRLSGHGFARPIIVTGEAFRFIAAEQLREAGVAAPELLIEPQPRNTAPAILAAALTVAAHDPAALIVAAPADHAIPDAEGFRAALRTAAPAARAGAVVTFGIRPDRPEPGYGHLEPETAAPEGPGGIRPLRRFVEKPGPKDAERMAADGLHLWNAGIFLLRADTLIAAFQAHAPEILSGVRAAHAAARSDLDFFRLDPAAWAKVEDISIDYAIMERVAGLMVMPFDGAWSDLGGWEAVWKAGDADAAGKVRSGHATAIDCEGTLLRSEAEGVELVGIGLRDIVAVAMPDAVLVARRDAGGQVREAVAVLAARGAPQATAFPRDHRPWGWFERLSIGHRYQVKRILVRPGAALSLQAHHHRSEHWIVVAGTARVTNGDAVRLLTENESVYIPLGTRHRLENPGKLDLELIEVQTGAYLGEDDIVRFEDVYARV